MADFATNFKNNPIPLVVAGVALLMLLMVMGSSCTIVEPGTAGVKVTLGQVSEVSLKEGLHFKAPFAEEVYLVDCRRLVATITATAASKDLQNVQTTVALNYRVNGDQAWSLFQSVGQTRDAWEIVLIQPAVQEVVKAVTARYNAEELVTERQRSKDDITQRIQERFEDLNQLMMEEVSITDFKFSAAFDAAIEAKQVAQQEAQRAENDKKRRVTDAEAERLVREQNSEAIAFEIERRATANAEQIRVAAEAEAKAVRVTAEAEAERIRVTADAESEALVRLAAAARDPALRARFIEKWDGQLPRVVAGGENGPLQFLVPLGDDTTGLESPRPRSQDNKARTPRLPQARDERDPR